MMEPKKLTMGELWKMEKGKIPMTEEGQQRLTEFNNAMSNVPKFGDVISAASKSLALQANFLKTPIIVSEHFKAIGGLIKISQINQSASTAIIAQMQTHHNALASITALWKNNQYAIHNSIASVTLGLNQQLRITNEQLAIVFKRVADDPELKRRFELLGEKEKLIPAVIEKWKDHLVWRMENRPFELFAHQFKYACYDLLDDADNNDALASLNEFDFKNILQFVADRIVEQDKEEHEKWKKERQGKTAVTNQQRKVTQSQLALFYYYCHEQEYLPAFQAGQMEQSYKAATKPYKLAWKPFQQFYNRFKCRTDRLATENRTSLKAAIQMLNDYPKALEQAQDDLKMAETRNPIT